MSGFEGSYLGDQSRIGKNSALECGVCWWVYDPSVGDDIWQIPAGTAFSDLPDHWRCPKCDAAQHQFMVLKKHRPANDSKLNQEEGPAADPLASVLQQIIDAYQRVDKTMRSLPVYNADLEVAVIGLRAWKSDYVAVVVTPWCMNIIVALKENDGRAEGTTRDYSFPSGSYPVVRGFLQEVGAIESCSLFSPMEQFDSQEAAVAVAEEAIAGLFTAATSDVADEADKESVELSRRNFLRGGKRAEEPRSSAPESRSVP